MLQNCRHPSETKLKPANHNRPFYTYTLKKYPHFKQSCFFKKDQTYACTWSW